MRLGVARRGKATASESLAYGDLNHTREPEHCPRLRRPEAADPYGVGYVARSRCRIAGGRNGLGRRSATPYAPTYAQGQAAAQKPKDAAVYVESVQGSRVPACRG